MMEMNEEVKLGRGGVTHYESLLASIVKDCSNQEVCDLTFVCSGDGAKIHSHSLLLAKVSSLVHESTCPLRQDQVVITLEGAVGSTVQLLLHFLLLGKIEVSEDEATKFHILCKMLRIDFGQSKVSFENRENLRESCKNPEKKRKRSIIKSSFMDWVQDSEQSKFTSLSSKKYKPALSSQTSPVSNIKSAIFATPKISSTSSIISDKNLYCYCRKPSSKDLIGCDFCPEWYHPDCIGLTEQQVDELLDKPSWKCQECHKSVKKKAILPKETKFCEVKATRIEAWDPKVFESKKGFFPLDGKTWKQSDMSKQIYSTTAKNYEEDYFPTENQTIISNDLLEPRKQEKDTGKESGNQNSMWSSNSCKKRVGRRRPDILKDDDTTKSGDLECHTDSSVMPVNAVNKDEENKEKEILAVEENDTVLKQETENSEARSTLQSNCDYVPEDTGNDSMKKRGRLSVKPKKEKISFDDTLQLIMKSEQEKLTTIKKTKEDDTDLTIKKGLAKQNSSATRINLSTTTTSLDSLTQAMDSTKQPVAKMTAKDTELYFCYICKSIFVSQKALDIHSKKAHVDD